MLTFSRRQIVTRVGGIRLGDFKNISQVARDICAVKNYHRIWTHEEDRMFREEIMNSDCDWEHIWKTLMTKTMVQIKARRRYYVSRTDGKYPEIVSKIR